jgi:hypothetical protein
MHDKRDRCCLSTQQRVMNGPFERWLFISMLNLNNGAGGDMQAASPILAWDTRICIPTGRQVEAGGYGGCQHTREAAKETRVDQGRPAGGPDLKWTAGFHEMPSSEILALSDEQRFLCLTLDEAWLVLMPLDPDRGLSWTKDCRQNSGGHRAIKATRCL